MGQKDMQGKRIKEKVQNSIKRNALSRKLSGVIIIVALVLIIVSLVFVFFIITMERKQYAERESENVLSSLSTSIGSDIDKYNKQYNNLNVIYDNTFHDRYFILDKEKVYHCGASINRIGYKTFSITLISDENVYNSLINRVV